MSHKSIVGIEIVGHQASVSLVTVFCLQLERVCAVVALCAEAAGVAVAYDLYETSLGLDGCERGVLVDDQLLHRGAAILALGAFL